MSPSATGEGVLEAMTGASKEEVRQGRQVGVHSSAIQLLGRLGKQVFTVALVYLMGYFNFSPAWLITPVIFSVIREEWKKDKELKRNIAKAAALSNEKDVILARVDDLPAWVFFPDVERAEWVNRIMKQVWPNVNHYAKDIIKATIEPAVQDNLIQYKLGGFSFKKMRLGTIAPRVGGIKVYDKNVARNEIIMDMDIFYAGDCDISFVLGGLSGGIKDFQIHGMVRVVMKPLINVMPLVGGLQIYFLNNPTIDFNLVGVADLLDMPGLSDMLRRIITEQIAAMMVLPNKLPIILNDIVPAKLLKFPEPQGVLRVHVVEAKNLMKKDINILGKGKSDPYAILTLGSETFRTKTIDNTVDPKWDFWCEYCVESTTGQSLKAFILDKDKTGKDESLGRATVEVLGTSKKGQTDQWVSLEEAKTGMVHLRMTWLSLSDKLADLKPALAETQMLRVTSMSSAVLMIFVDSAKNLPSGGGKNGGTNPDPICHLSVCKVSKTSSTQYRTDCPVYEQGFTFLVNNPENDTLHIKFVDFKTSTELGILNYNLSALLDKEGLELEDQPLQLQKSGPDSKVILSMRLRIMKYTGGVTSNTDEPDLMEEDITSSSPLISRVPSTKQSTPKAAPEPSQSFEAVEKKIEEELKPINEVMVATQAPPKVESSPSVLHHRQPSTTSVTSQFTIDNSRSSGENGLGKIQLTFRYSVQRQMLIVVVHKIANLPLKEPTNIPDPYVKLYLLPERAKETKRKTETVKDNCNPTYDQTFEYVMSQGEMGSRQLEVTVLTQKAWKSPVMGQVIINLCELDLNKGLTSWFDLQPGTVKEKEV